MCGFCCHFTIDRPIPTAKLPNNCRWAPVLQSESPRHEVHHRTISSTNVKQTRCEVKFADFFEAFFTGQIINTMKAKLYQSSIEYFENACEKMKSGKLPNLFPYFFKLLSNPGAEGHFRSETETSAVQLNGPARWRSRLRRFTAPIQAANYSHGSHSTTRGHIQTIAILNPQTAWVRLHGAMRVICPGADLWGVVVLETNFRRVAFARSAKRTHLKFPDFFIGLMHSSRDRMRLAKYFFSGSTNSAILCAYWRDPNVTMCSSKREETFSMNSRQCGLIFVKSVGSFLCSWKTWEFWNARHFYLNAEAKATCSEIRLLSYVSGSEDQPKIQNTLLTVLVHSSKEKTTRPKYTFNRMH